MNETMGQNLVVEKKHSGEQLRGAAVPRMKGDEEGRKTSSGYSAETFAILSVQIFQRGVFNGLARCCQDIDSNNRGFPCKGSFSTLFC
jgi:hypothetical protein